MLPFLESHPDIYVASAFNDNGQTGKVKDAGIHPFNTIALNNIFLTSFGLF